MEVALVRWPGEQARLAELRRSETPRLLFIEEGTAAPIVRDVAEDWIRVPASDADIRARVAALAARVRALTESVPELVDEVLVFSNTRAVLSPLEARLAGNLVQSFGSVAERGELLAAGWPRGDADSNDLDVHILRLRRRIEPLGLAIKTVRGKGYVLANAARPAGTPTEVQTPDEAADAAASGLDETTAEPPPVKAKKPKKSNKPKGKQKPKKSKKSKTSKERKKRKKSKKRP